MPIREYTCENCNFYKEELEFEENVVHVCPDCGQQLKRMFPTSLNFRLIYNPKKDKCDWNGGTTQYYNEYKRRKEAGEKDLVIPGE